MFLKDKSAYVHKEFLVKIWNIIEDKHFVLLLKGLASNVFFLENDLNKRSSLTIGVLYCLSYTKLWT